MFTRQHNIERIWLINTCHCDDHSDIELFPPFIRMICQMSQKWCLCGRAQVIAWHTEYLVFKPGTPLHRCILQLHTATAHNCCNLTHFLKEKQPFHNDLWHSRWFNSWWLKKHLDHRKTKDSELILTLPATSWSLPCVDPLGLLGLVPAWALVVSEWGGCL